MRLFSSKRLTKLILTCGFYAVCTTLLSGCWIDTYSHRPVNISFDGSNNPGGNYLLLLRTGGVELRSWCAGMMQKDIGFYLRSNNGTNFNLEYSRLISNDGTIYEGRLKKNVESYADYDITFEGLGCKDLDKYKLLIAPVEIYGFPILEIPPIQFKTGAIITNREFVTPAYFNHNHK